MNAHVLRIKVDDGPFSEASDIGILDHSIDLAGLHMRPFKQDGDPSRFGMEISGYGEHVFIADFANPDAGAQAAVARLRGKIDGSPAKERLAHYRAVLVASMHIGSTTSSAALRPVVPNVVADGFWSDCIAPWIAMIVDVAMVVAACSPADAFWGCLWAIAWMTYDVPLEAQSFVCNCLGYC